jgi:hypothetical protein
MEGNPVNVSAKGPCAVMVLAMYVVCDCPTHSDETCSGRDGEKPPFRKKYVDKIAESDATLAADHPCGFVETKNPVEAITLDQAAACVEARIPVTSALPKGKQAARLSGIEDLGNLVIPRWFVYLTMLGPWIAAPRKNMLGVKRGWGAFAFGQTRR